MTCRPTCTAVRVGARLDNCAAMRPTCAAAQVTNLGLKAEASGTEGGATRLGAPPLPEGEWLPHRGSSVEHVQLRGTVVQRFDVAHLLSVRRQVGRCTSDAFCVAMQKEGTPHL